MIGIACFEGDRLISYKIGWFRIKSARFARTSNAVPTRVENLKPALSLPAVPFLFRRMFLFLSLFLLPFVISTSLFLATPPFPLFTVPLLAFVRSFVRSLRCLALGMRGRCTSLSRALARLLAPSVSLSISISVSLAHASY